MKSRLTNKDRDYAGDTTYTTDTTPQKCTIAKKMTEHTCGI